MDKVNEALVSQKKKGDVDMNVAETVPLTPYKEYHRNQHHEGGDRGNNSDEDMEDEGHGQRGGVRC